MIKFAWRLAAIEAGHVCRVCNEPIPEKKWGKAVKNGSVCDPCLLNRRNDLEMKRYETDFQRNRIKYS